jgi:hypothetical protein
VTLNYINVFLGIHGNRNQVDPSLITMREDPNIEFGRLDLEQDFGFGIDPTEMEMMNDKLQNAFHGEGLFEEPTSVLEPGKRSIFILSFAF